jgi:hypothetical protein
MKTTSILLSMFLTVTGVLTSTPAFAAGKQCDALFEAPGKKVDYAFPASAAWRKTPGNLFDGFRANAAHNWNYFKTNSSRSKNLREAFGVEGIVVGDFHILNFGEIERPDKKRKIGLIDLDDGGVGPLFGDFARGAVGNQISPYKIPMKEIWKAYLMGLQGKKTKEPEVVEKALGKSQKDYLEVQEQNLHKLTGNGKFSAEAGVTPISEAPESIAKIFRESQSAFKQPLGDATILDFGFKIKETGGSQNIPRFWFLVEKDKEKSIIEFKTLGQPAIDLFQAQLAAGNRIASLIATYRPKGQTLGTYQFLDAGPYQFIARARLKPFLSLDPDQKLTKDVIDEGRQFYFYLFNRAGLWQAEQGKGDALYAALTKNEKASFSELQDLINDYVQLMQKENL